MEETYKKEEGKAAFPCDAYDKNEFKPLEYKRRNKVWTSVGSFGLLCWSCKILVLRSTESYGFIRSLGFHIIFCPRVDIDPRIFVRDFAFKYKKEAHHQPLLYFFR